MKSISTSITQQESVSLTLEELSTKLKDESIIWEEKDDKDKYGVFYMFKVNRGKKVILSFSRKLDFQNYEQDSEILF